MSLSARTLLGDARRAPLRLALPGIRQVWIALTLAGAFVGPASAPIGSPDIFWTLLSGRWMVDHAALLSFDPFTSAPHADGPLVNVQWLADVAYYGLEAAGGLPLVIAVTALAIASTYALILVAAHTASQRLRLSCVAVWLAYALGVTNLNPRPQTLAYPLFGLAVLAIARAEWRADTRLLWLLPAATLVWANLHGSFVLVFVLLGCAALGRLIATRQPRRARPYLLTLAGCLLLSCVNPYGPGALLAVVSVAGNPIVRQYVTEWAPTTLAAPEGVLLFGSLVLIGGLLLRTQTRTRLTPVEAIVLLVFGALGWSSVRGVVWWGLVSAPIVARLLADLSTPQLSSVSRQADRPLLNAVIVGSIATLVVASLPWVKTSLPFLPSDKRGLLSDDTPVRVANALRDDASAAGSPLFAEQSWAGYLEWVTWPHHRLFVDGRFELYPAQVWFDYLDIVFPGARWRALLDRYGIQQVVLSTSEHPELIAELRADAAWRIDYDDGQAVVFSQTSSAPP